MMPTDSVDQDVTVQERSTGRTIWLGFGAMLGLFMLLLGLAVGELRKMDARVVHVVNDGLEHTVLLQEMHAAARQRSLLLVELMSETDPFLRDEMLLRYDALGGRFASARQKLADHELDVAEQRLMARQAAAVDDSQGAQRAVIDAAMRDDGTHAQTLLVREAIPAQEAMLSVLGELSAYVTDRARAESRAARLGYERTRNLVWLGGGLIALSGIGVAWWVKRRMVGLMDERAGLTQALHETLRDLSFQKHAMDEHAIVSIANAAGDIIYANDNFCKVSGYPRSDMLGQSHRILKSGIHPETMYQEMWDTIVSGRVWHGEVCNRARNGHLYWVKTTIVPFLDTNGLPYQYVSIRTDITAAKEAEAQLQKSKQELEQRVAERTVEVRDQLRFTSELMEALPNPIFYKNVKGHYLGVNKAWEALFGIDRKRIVGNKLDMLYPQAAEIAAKHIAMDEALWRDGGTQQYEISIPVANGDIRNVMYYKAALTSEEGHITGLVGAIVDMTEHRQTERTLEQFKCTLDQTQDCVFMFSPVSLRFFYANHGAAEQVGYSLDQLMSMTPLDIKPAFTEKSFREMLRPLLGGHGGAITFETMHRHKDGHEIPVEVVLQYVETSGAPRFVSVVRDTSERKRVESEIRKRYEEVSTLNAQLQDMQHQLLQSEKMASIGQLAAGVAHEVNNPIGYVYSNLGTLEHYLHDLFEVIAAYESTEPALADMAARAVVEQARQKADLAFLKEDVGSIMGECREGITRVKKIVQDLKDFSRIDTSEEWQWADLHAGLDSTLNIVRNELKYKTEIIKEYGVLPEVECLPSQLNQVFLNMLVNAGHAIEEHGTITLRTGVEVERVWVEIEDSGKGIPPEHLKRIFDPFFTTKPVGTGTGLGLSLSYGIVSKHHGEIEVHSEPGKGSCFRIWLPVRQQTPLAVEEQTHA